MKNLFPLFVFSLLFVACNEKKNTDVDSSPKYAIGLVKTSLGEMYFWLYNETPKHKEKFIELANAKHYDQFTFNRVVNDFVIQGGCPDSVQYFKDSPYLLDPEFNDSIKHVYGAMGMGRDNNPEKRSNACQIYIVSKESGLPKLDGDYMIFGIIIKGKNVLENIESQQTDSNNKPLENISMEVQIVNLTENELMSNFSFELP